MPKLGEVTEAERLRRRSRLSVGELARLGGVSHSLVSQVEAGRTRPSARYRARIANVLGVPEGIAFSEARG
jgi:transcriptional regulator with XRE-family HTH domain